MKNKVKIKGTLKTYLQASLYLGVLLCIIDLSIWFFDYRAGILLTCFTILYISIIMFLLHHNKPIILNELISFATEYGQIQRKLLLKLTKLPMIRKNVPENELRNISRQ